MDPLIALSPTMEPQPALATQWSVINPTTWELKLRTGVKFQNGDPFTAKDVKFNFDRILDPKTQSRQLSVYYAKVAGVAIVDDFTVRITTNGPWPGILAAISFMRVAPADYFQKVGADAFAQHPIGTGPYEFVSWVKDGSVTLKANPDYWRGPAKIKNVTFKVVTDNSSRVAQLLAGDADLIDNVPPSLAAQIKGRSDLQLGTVRSMNTMFIGMNSFVKPFDDIRVRQALNYAINWQQIIDGLLNGSAVRNASSTGALTLGYDSTVAPYPYDPAKARQLLAEAGYPQGFSTTFAGPVGRYTADKLVGEAVAGQLQQVGIRTQYEGSDFNDFFTKFLSNAALSLSGGARGKASQIQGLYLLGCNNAVGGDFDFCNRLHLSSKTRGIYFNTPELDAKLDAVSAETNATARLGLAKDAYRFIHDQAPWVFAYDDILNYGAKAGLTWTPRPDAFIDVYGASWSR